MFGLRRLVERERDLWTQFNRIIAKRKAVGLDGRNSGCPRGGSRLFSASFFFYYYQVLLQLRINRSDTFSFSTRRELTSPFPIW